MTRPLPPTRTYPSKVDALFIAIMALALAAVIAGVIVGGVKEGPLRMAQGGFVVLGVAGFLVWILRGTNYKLDGDRLIVRSGPMRWTIPIADISSIEKPHGFRRGRSSPSLSWDRLVIVYGRNKRLTISPDDKEKFLADLKARQSH